MQGNDDAHDINMNSRNKEISGKKELVTTDPNYTISNPKNNNTSSSRQWSSYKNPRIVRVSRAFRGKDRHSKVSTVRGLRDRRIRLSIPTAIQLYDLQDRLGLSQPSKVVDWLLDVTKHEVIKLPPLPIIPQLIHQFPVPGSQESTFAHSHHSTLSHYLQETKEGQIKINESENFLQENQEGLAGFVAQNLFPGNNQSSSSSSFSSLPYNPYYNLTLDQATRSLSLSHHQFGGGFSYSNQTGNTPSYISPQMEIDQLRQINNHSQHAQQNFPTTLHLISSPMKSFSLNKKRTFTGKWQWNTRE